MRAAIIEKPGSVRVRTVADPTPEPDQLIIRVGACGICGTDLHIAQKEVSSIEDGYNGYHRLRRAAH